MPRMVAALLILATGLCPVLRGQTPPEVRIEAITPDPADRLAGAQNLSIRVSYASAQPLRFQAVGYWEGRKRENLYTNVPPEYPPGKGEAMASIFGQAGARIDEVKIEVLDAQWKPIASAARPVKIEWHAGIPAAAEAPWAAQLRTEQQRLLAENAKHAEGGTLATAGAGLFAFLAMACVPAYPLLQLYALWKLRGPMRLLSAVPLSFMLPVYGICAYALQQNASLWPIYMIFASPIALVITGVVLLAGRRVARAQQSQA